MSMAERDEGGSRWTNRAQQARCVGSGRRDPIRYSRRHSTSQMHQDHLESCVDQEQEDDTLVCSPCTTSAMRFWHAKLPHDEPIAMYAPRGEEEAGYMWQMKRGMSGTRRASRLFQEHMKGFLGEAGYAALKVRHQVCYCLENGLRLDEVLKRLVVVKVLDRVGPGTVEHGQYLKRHIVYIEGQGFEWLEDPKHLAAISEIVSKIGAKPKSTPGSKDLGRSDPEALDDLAEVEAKLYQQDAGISIYVSSGRFDIQMCVNRPSEMISKPRKLGNLRLARLARYLVGTQKLTLRFNHQEYGDIVRIP